MIPRANHISVCVCTFKRPILLRLLLTELQAQSVQSAFTYSIVVADNDVDGSAEAIVGEFASHQGVPVLYCVEPEQNIALVRNTAIRHADGDYIAFIDDDEVPVRDWLYRLWSACKTRGADGILGPVNPYFDTEPPKWVLRGKFFERPVHPDGYQLSWPQCRTGNVLFRRSILEGLGSPFRPEFGTGGEDVDFFHRMADLGKTFFWCSEAIANELVPPSRCKRGFLLRRALLRGSNFPKLKANTLRHIFKSVIAVPTYTLALPVLFIFGQHVALKYLIKLCDHTSRLLALSGIVIARERET